MATPTATPTAEPTPTPIKVGLVTDLDGIDDESLQATSWAGMEMAAEEFGVEIAYLESQRQADYAANIAEFLDQGYDMVVTVGFRLGVDTAALALQNPDTNFAIVDFAYNPPIGNVLGLTFATDQAAFLAGYLAAGMTQTGKVATFGGIDIPSVTVLMTGFESGVQYYNEVHETDIEVLGMDLYTGSFESTNDSHRAAESLIAEGADIIMPVAGPGGLGAAAAAQANPGTMLIGVETDWCVSAAEYCDVMLTSVMKNADVAVRDAIQAGNERSFEGGTYVGTLENGGVSLAPFNEFEEQVPDALKDELEEVEQGLIAGDIRTGWGTTVPYRTQIPAYKVKPLVIGTTDSISALDPAQSNDAHTWEIHHNTMDTLLTYIPGTTQLQPGLALTYTVTGDGLQYTFTLREGLKFPDGTDLNAEAVVWSIERVLALEGAPSQLVSSYVDRVEAVDETTVRFVLKGPVGFFPVLVATPPYAPVSPSCYPEDEIDPDSTCGGIGHYEIWRWTRDVEMELVANPDYYGDPPAYPHIIVRNFADPTVMRLALEAGDIDVAWKSMNRSDYDDFRESANYDFYAGPGRYIQLLGFNTRIPPFDDPEVRRAVSLAIDRDAISDTILQSTHESLYSVVPTGMVEHIEAFGERNLEQAQALLANTPVAMDLWWTPDLFGPAEEEVAAAIEEALEETGVIRVTLQSADGETYADQISQGLMPVFLLDRSPDVLDPDSYTSPFAECGPADETGIFYCEGAMDRLLLDARLTTDQEERTELYAQVQELWADEVPTIPLTQGLQFAVTQKGITGVVLDPTGFLHYFTLLR
jgi:peptide/nickel transport system substrate-binding protein